MERQLLQYQSSKITFRVKTKSIKLRHIKRHFSVLNEKKSYCVQYLGAEESFFGIQIQVQSTKPDTRFPQ